MRVCLINSSYEGTKSPFEEYDELPDPGRYIDKSHHEFVTRYVTKTNAKAEIDEICEEGFDLYMNYMWGAETDNIAGVEATRYLESKGVTVLTNPSSFLEKDKYGFQKAAEKFGLRVPGNTPGKYPKIVKYADACGSLSLDKDSICYTEEEVNRRVQMLKEGNSIFDVMVQDFIVGKECAAIVVEMGHEVVSLTPMQYVFPENTPESEAFLTWYNKFEAINKGIIKCVLVEEEPHQSNLQTAAADAFKALGITGGGWSRVDMRLEQSTGNIYVIEVNPIPCVFYPAGNSLSDDMVVTERYPGGQTAFFDMLLATKQIQMGSLNKQINQISGVYDKFAPSYRASWELTNMANVVKLLAANYDFTGTVLDVACGDGAVGEVLHDHGNQAEITGIEISKGMLQAPSIKQHYKDVRIGAMQELIMSAGQFDHIVCMGALHFLDRVSFNAVLSRMFMLARKSVTFEVDDLSEAYITGAKLEAGDLFFNANHTQDLEMFGTPYGWKRVYYKSVFLYTSPHIHVDVYGTMVRFERA